MVLQLDQGEEVRITADHRGGAVISQPNRPDGTVALPARVARRPAQRGTAPAGPGRALQRRPRGGHRARAASRERSPEREHVWFDPAEDDESGEPADAASLPRRRDAAGSDTGPVPDVVIEPDADRLARAVAEALVARLAAAQTLRGTASVVLTGGTIGIAVLERVAGLAAEPVRETVDWASVDVWWGDERFVPAERRRAQREGRAAGAARPVGVDPARVHAMPASDGGFAEPEDAAARYADELAAAAGDGGAVPRFDVLLLGMGPEGHVASIFPDSPAIDDERPVFAVRDCPKPPPTRVSLGYTAIGAAEEVWVVVSGEGKAEAVARALSGAEPRRAPGRRRARHPGDALAARRRRGRPAARDAERYIPRRARRRVSASSRRASPSASVRRSRT